MQHVNCNPNLNCLPDCDKEIDAKCILIRKFCDDDNCKNLIIDLCKDNVSLSNYIDSLCSYLNKLKVKVECLEQETICSIDVTLN